MAGPRSGNALRQSRQKLEEAEYRYNQNIQGFSVMPG
jgi:hypothetical protein